MKKLLRRLLCITFALVGCEDLDVNAIQDILDDIEIPQDPIFIVNEEGNYIVSVDGGEVEIVVYTNLDFYVYIPNEAREWVSYADTRVIRREKLAFTVAANKTGKERRAVIDLVGLDGEVLQRVDFVQQGESTGLIESDKITLKVSGDYVKQGDIITFKVIDSMGEDITSKSEIFYGDSKIVRNAQFRCDRADEYHFYAAYKSMKSKTVTVRVITSILLNVPDDHCPECLEFVHHPLIITHGGVDCEAFPYAMDNLLMLKSTEWNGRYNEVYCHAGPYALNDPANSVDATCLREFQSALVDSTDPSVLINHHNRLPGYSLDEIESGLGDVWKSEGADIGVAMAVVKGVDKVVCYAQLKSAVSQEYCVNVWLLENNIYCPYQVNATSDYHKFYNRAIRKTSELFHSNSIEGRKIGNLNRGSTTYYSCEIPVIGNMWNIDNMEALIVVSAKNDNKQWDVVNSVCCPINKSVCFQYVGESVNIVDADVSYVKQLESPVVRIVDISDSSFTVAWDPIKDATEYTISINDDMYYDILETSFKYENLCPGVYQVRVRAESEGVYCERSLLSEPIDVNVVGASSAEWFTQTVCLPDNNDNNAVKGINSSNAISVNWSGDNIEELKYGAFITEYMPASYRGILTMMQSVDADTIKQANEGGVDYVFENLMSNTEYTVCAYIGRGGEYHFITSKITTAQKITTLGAKAWTGMWECYTPQVVDITSNTFSEQRTDLKLTITEYDDKWSNYVSVRGLSVFGDNVAALGVVYHEKDANGEFTGNYTLHIMGGHPVSELSNSEYQAQWMPLCSINDSSYVYMLGEFPAYTLTLYPTKEVICQPLRYTSYDGDEVEVKMIDVFGLDSSYDKVYSVKKEGEDYHTIYRAGGIMGMNKKSEINIFPLSKSIVVPVDCREIPISMVIAM